MKTTVFPRERDEDRRNLLKALTALEVVIDQWAKEINVRGFAENLAAMPDEKRAHAIESAIETFMMEAAYRACTDDTGGIDSVVWG